MPGWLVTSLVLSVLLTVALNVLPRVFPGASRKAEDRLHEAMTQSPDGSERSRRVRVFFPWKAMLVASVLLTIIVNVVGSLSG